MLRNTAAVNQTEPIIEGFGKAKRQVTLNETV
jgi:hypothetical protein